MPSLVKPKSKRRGQSTRTSGVYHIRFYCPIRRRSVVISTRCRNQRNADRCLREFCDLLERGEVGLENPFLARRQQRIDEADRLEISTCLTAFESDLRAGRVRRGKRKAVSSAHAALAMSRIRKITEGCHVRRVNDLSTDAVNSLLDRLQQEGSIRTAQTRKHHERAIKSFSKWLSATGRLDRDPLARLAVTAVESGDLVHERGAFTTDEVEAIATAAKVGPSYKWLAGPLRSLLYVFASSTGFRAKECAAVRKADLGPDLTHVCIAGLFTKNGKDAQQPLPSFLRLLLKDYVATLADEDFLWPGGWRRDDKGCWVEAGWVAGKEAGQFLRRDAAAVGIVIGRQGRDANGGRVLDFHSFRHSFVTALAKAGISEGLSRKLARASCQAILARYTHREFEELSTAVEHIPAFQLTEKPAVVAE